MPGSSHKTEFNSPIAEYSLALVTEVNGVWSGFGSGIIIGQRLALTARHVIKNAWRQNEKILLPQDDHLIRGTDEEFGGWESIAKELKFYAINYHRKQSRFLTWNVQTTWYDSFTDIAVLRLNPHCDGWEDFEWGKVTMTARLPDLNSAVYAFGYHSPRVDFLEKTGEYRVLSMQNEPTSSDGSVLQVCESSEAARAAGRVFPGMRTDLPVMDSMSGGPVFSQGKLCGIISSSLSTEHGNECYVAGLWPILCLPLGGLGMTAAKAPEKEIGYFQDLVERGVLEMDDWRSVKCTPHPSGGISIRGFNGKSQIAKRSRF